MRLYDISRPIAPETPVWPGDAAYRAASALRMADGASVNLTTLTLSPHTGAHADARFHYQPDGADAAALPLEPFLGPAQVVSTTRADGPLMPDDFAPDRLGRVPRVLVRSPLSSGRADRWPERFPYLSEPLIAHLAARGVVLIGLDSPSVDHFESKTLPCHHALARHGLFHLESLWLADVPDGVYDLIALPLMLAGACASPVRAVLCTRPDAPSESPDRERPEPVEKTT